MTIGQYIDRYIKDHETTAAELAKRVNVKPSTVYRWINNETVPKKDALSALVAIGVLSPREALDAA